MPSEKMAFFNGIKNPQIRGDLGWDWKTQSKMAQRTGLEPATPGVTGRYSDQLNYRCKVNQNWWVVTDSNR